MKSRNQIGIYVQQTTNGKITASTKHKRQHQQKSSINSNYRHRICIVIIFTGHLYGDIIELGFLLTVAFYGMTFMNSITLSS